MSDLVKMANKHADGISTYAPDGVADLLRLLADRIAELEAAQGWQTMDSAPKDGTRILVLTKYGPFTGHWAEDVEGMDGSWFVHGITEAVQQSEATHWLPLPTPPEESE